MYVKIGGADVIQLHIFNMEMIGEANYDKCDVTRLQSFSLVRDWTAEEVVKWITLKTIFDASTYSPFVIFKIFHFKKCISKIVTKWLIVNNYLKRFKMFSFKLNISMKIHVAFIQEATTTKLWMKTWFSLCNLLLFIVLYWIDWNIYYKNPRLARSSPPTNNFFLLLSGYLVT